MSRTHRMWDFTVGHSQLVYRAPGDSESTLNDDHIFAGVEYIQIPTSVTDMEVWPSEHPDTSASSINTELRTFRISGRDLSGGPVTGFVLAVEHSHETNSRDFGDSGLRDVAEDMPLTAQEYEKRVILALSRAPDVDLVIPRAGQQPDVIATLGGSVKLLIEIKWFNNRPLGRSIRSSVMQIVELLNNTADADGLLVILGGTDPDAAPELRAHLTSAVGARTTFAVELWNPTSGEDQLYAAIEAFRPIESGA